LIEDGILKGRQWNYYYCSDGCIAVLVMLPLVAVAPVIVCVIIICIITALIRLPR